MKILPKIALLTTLSASVVYAAPTGKIIAETKTKVGVFSAASGKRLSTFTKYQPPKVVKGAYEAISTDTELRVRNTKTGAARTIFSTKKPQPMFDAINRAKFPKKLENLKGGIDPELWKGQYSWQLSDGVFSPDYSRVFFASNAGTGMGAAGNATWAFFAYDLKTNRLDVLSKVGEQFGRPPSPFLISKDGKHLLSSVSVHSSAIENPCYVLVVDLLTQQSRELVLSLPEAKGKANLLNNVIFSPDSKYVAASVYFYATAPLINSDKFEDFEPKDGDFTTYIFETQTGKLVRKIANSTVVNWTR